MQRSFTEINERILLKVGTKTAFRIGLVRHVRCILTRNHELETNRIALITIRWIALLAIAGSAGVHLSIVPVQFSHSVAHGSFFLLIGLAQFGWAVAFWRFPAKVWCFIGLGLSGGMVILWALTRLVSVPYAPSAAPIDIWLILSKMAEINGFVALVGYLAIIDLDDSQESGVTWTVVGAVTLAIGFGVLVWGAGHFAETAAPSLGHGVPKEDNLPQRQPDQPPLQGATSNDGGADPADHQEFDSTDARLGNPAKGLDANAALDVKIAL